MAKLFAFEEDEVAADTAAPAADVQAEQEVAELAEDSVSVDEGVTAVDDGEEAAAQLEEVGEVVAATVDGEGEQQGLDPVAAEAVRIAVESICSRMGASTKQFYALYATENFQSKSSRVANTKIALESIVDTLKNVWAKIVAFLKGLVAKVVAFWNKLVYNVNGAQKAIKALQKKVKDNDGSKPSDIKNFVVPRGVSKAFNEPTIDATFIAATLKTISTVLSGFTAAFAESKKDGSLKFSNNLAVGVKLTFNKVILAKSLTSSKDDDTGEQTIKATIEINDSGESAPESTSSPVLSKAEMSSVLTAAADLLTAQASMSTQVNTLVDSVRTKELENEKAIAAIIRSNSGTANKDAEIDQKKEAMKKFNKDRADLLNRIKLASPKLQVISVRSARAAMDYVKANLALYK